MMQRSELNHISRELDKIADIVGGRKKLIPKSKDKFVTLKGELQKLFRTVQEAT